MGQTPTPPIAGYEPPAERKLLSDPVGFVSVPKTLGGGMLRFLRHQVRNWLLVLGVGEFSLLVIAFCLAAFLRSFVGPADLLDELSAHLFPRAQSCSHHKFCNSFEA